MHEFNSTAKYAFVKCQKTLGIDFLKNVLNKTITLNRVLTEAFWTETATACHTC